MDMSSPAVNKKYPAIVDGTFFKVVEENGNKIKAKCLNCVPNKVYSAELNGTSNLLNHLKVRLFLVLKMNYSLSPKLATISTKPYS